MLLLLLRFLILDLLYLLSSDESDSLDDESSDDESDSRYSSTYSFPAFSLQFENFADSVSRLGSGVFVPTGIKSKCGFCVCCARTNRSQIQRW